MILKSVAKVRKFADICKSFCIFTKKERQWCNEPQKLNKKLLGFITSAIGGDNITNNFLFFQLEWERADEVAVAEEVDGIESGFDVVDGPIAGAVIVLSAVLYLLHEGIVDLLILEGEE